MCKTIIVRPLTLEGEPYPGIEPVDFDEFYGPNGEYTEAAPICTCWVYQTHSKEYFEESMKLRATLMESVIGPMIGQMGIGKIEIELW